MKSISVILIFLFQALLFMIQNIKFLLLLLFFCLPVAVYCSENTRKQQVQNWSTKQASGFTENKGQVTDQNGNIRNDVKYIYSAPGMKVIFKANSFSYEVYTIEKNQNISEASGKTVNQNPLPDKNLEPENVTFRTHRIDVNLSGANKNPQIIVQGKSQDYSNYYLAHTPEEGIQQVFSYNQLTYKSIWPNIDIVFYAKKEGELKYDIVLHPGADINNVQFAYNGAGNIKLVNESLIIGTSLGKIEETVPLSYLDESKEKVAIGYSKSGNTISFTGSYDKSKTLVIDPKLIWATYFGGANNEHGESVTTCSSGNIYFCGYTQSISSVATTGAHQTSNGGNILVDAFLTKFNRAGDRIWATYYGGDQYDDATSISLDEKGSVFIGGWTSSLSAISTSGSHQSTHAGTAYYDAFLAKFDTSGVRKWGTYYGGKAFDFGRSVKCDNSGNVYMAGETASTTGIASTNSHQNLFGGGLDAFLLKFDSSGNRLWATYYGGPAADYGLSLTVDESKNVFMAGYTGSNSKIATSASHKDTFSGLKDGYFVKFDSSGKQLYATYFGGSNNDRVDGITIDKDNNIYIAGLSQSLKGIATAGAFKSSISGNSEVAFLAKFDTSGKQKWGTYYGTVGTNASSVSVDLNYNIYITGGTLSSTGISTADGYQTNYNSVGSDGFVVRFDKDGNRLYGSYFGGNTGEDYAFSITTDLFGNTYILGYTRSNSNIATTGSYQSTLGGTGGNFDAFLAKFNFSKPDAGVGSIDSIENFYCTDSFSKPVYIRIKNYSLELNLDSVYIGYNINGISGTPIKYISLIKPNQFSKAIYLRDYSFKRGQNKIIVWTYKPNGVIDEKRLNDTLALDVQIFISPTAKFDVKIIALQKLSIFLTQVQFLPVQ